MVVGLVVVEYGVFWWPSVCGELRVAGDVLLVFFMLLYESLIKLNSGTSSQSFKFLPFKSSF